MMVVLNIGFSWPILKVFFGGKLKTNYIYKLAFHMDRVRTYKYTCICLGYTCRLNRMNAHRSSFNSLTIVQSNPCT